MFVLQDPLFLWIPHKHSVLAKEPHPVYHLLGSYPLSMQHEGLIPNELAGPGDFSG